jgi:hypothetical protein
MRKTPATVTHIAGRRWPEWYEDPAAVLEVGEWMEERGELPPLPSEWRSLFEKPWKFAAERHRLEREWLTDPDDDGPRAA